MRNKTRTRDFDLENLKNPKEFKAFLDDVIRFLTSSEKFFLLNLDGV